MEFSTPFHLMCVFCLRPLSFTHAENEMVRVNRKWFGCNRRTMMKMLKMVFGIDSHETFLQFDITISISAIRKAKLTNIQSIFTVACLYTFWLWIGWRALHLPIRENSTIVIRCKVHGGLLFVFEYIINPIRDFIYIMLWLIYSNPVKLTTMCLMCLYRVFCVWISNSQLHPHTSNERGKMENMEQCAHISNFRNECRGWG